MRIAERSDGVRTAEECSCRVERRIDRSVERANISKRHQHCRLDNYEPHYAGANGSLSEALRRSREFVREYPVGTMETGLLFVGGYGVGKTHLAVSILHDLIVTKNAKGMFCDYRTLLKQIQDSYGRSDVSERQVLAPIFEADVLVIDELGAAKPTEWVWDTVQHILNTRYNDRRTTIITTNYPNEKELQMGAWDHLPTNRRDAQKAMYRDNLGDRITERMRSRLLEMCVVVEMNGKDYRESEGRASFATRSGMYADMPDPGPPKQPRPGRIKFTYREAEASPADRGPVEEVPVGPARMGKAARLRSNSGTD